jgi:hypothetical protein
MVGNVLESFGYIDAIWYLTGLRVLLNQMPCLKTMEIAVTLRTSNNRIVIGANVIFRLNRLFSLFGNSNSGGRSEN